MSGGRERELQSSGQEFAPKALVEQGIDSLLTELAQGKSQRLEQYLAFTSRFHQYSTHNQFLIYLQCPQATYVAGYRTWQELGYQVSRGQKAIRIFAPRPRKRLSDESGEEEQMLSFVPVSVFDVSQLAHLAEKPLPEFFTPLADDQEALFARVAQVVQEDGITLIEKPTGWAQGYSAGGHIALKQGLDSQSKVLVLLHEYTHEVLHKGVAGQMLTKQLKECHAEAVSYVVAHHFGIRNPFSSDYIQHWGNTRATLVGELDLVRATARLFIDRIEQHAN